jgi:hypothetical protein
MRALSVELCVLSVTVLKKTLNFQHVAIEAKVSTHRHGEHGVSQRIFNNAIAVY